MDLKLIEEKLNKQFNDTERNIVYWYDEKGKFRDEIDSLNLPRATICKLDGYNLFSVKKLIEKDAPEQNFLIYAPFPKPKDSENHLADLLYYSIPFFADKISMVRQELGIDEKNNNIMNKYNKFFEYEKYIRPFKALEIDRYNADIIQVGIMAVLCNIKIPNFEEVLKVVILDNEETDNKYIKEFERIGVSEFFWNRCSIMYGYESEMPSIEGLIETMIYTYAEQKITTGLPKRFNSLISNRKNDIEVFINNMMNNMKTKDDFDVIAEHYAKKLAFDDEIKKMTFTEYTACDIFSDCDKMTIISLADFISKNNSDIREYVGIIEERLNMHYGEKYRNQYKALLYANELLCGVADMKLEIIEDHQRVIDRYTQTWYAIDKAYRKFYYYYDRINKKEGLTELRQYIENVYTNDFLYSLSIQWSKQVAKVGSYKEIQNKPQRLFYDKTVRPASVKQCTAVIISDAFRYECGVELFDELKKNAAFTPVIDYMISSMPSYTALGMASLLPNKEITFNDNYDVLVDGMKCASTEQREKILQVHDKESVAVSYDVISNMKRDEVKKLLNGKNIVYIYHNQIDARGDHKPSENEVFNAAEESIQEINKLILKLMFDKSITSFIVTADHGFIYKRDKLSEGDKMSIDASGNISSSRRYVLSDKPLNLDGSFDFGLEYLADYNHGKHVAVPMGMDVYKAGGGLNFVHGGISPQEIIIPLITIKGDRYKQEKKDVELFISSNIRKISSLVSYIEFMQRDNISDVILPVTATVCIEDDEGNRISTEVIINADKKNAEPPERMFKEKFTLKNAQYTVKKSYYVVGRDEKDNRELFRKEIIIDIPFADDLGF